MQPARAAIKFVAQQEYSEGSLDVWIHFETSTKHRAYQGMNGTCQFWIKPVALAENIGFSAHELNKLVGVISENQDLIERAWHEHFSA